MPHDEARFETVTYTYYEQLNGYEHLKQLDIGYFFYAGSYVDEHPARPQHRKRRRSSTSPTSTPARARGTRLREVEHIIEELGEWQGADPTTGFQLVGTSDGRVLRIADLVDDDPARNASG